MARVSECTARIGEGAQCQPVPARTPNPRCRNGAVMAQLSGPARADSGNARRAARQGRSADGSKRRSTAPRAAPKAEARFLGGMQAFLRLPAPIVCLAQFGSLSPAAESWFAIREAKTKFGWLTLKANCVSGLPGTLPRSAARCGRRGALPCVASLA